MKYHLFAHMDRNRVRKGDKVEKYKTILGTIGDGNGSYKYGAHLHFSISEGLTVSELIKYVGGWSQREVTKYYQDPRHIDFEEMFGRKIDVGNRGFNWLQWIGYGYHPGVDLNGHSGGNTDFGWEFTSSCSGTVIYEKRTWFKNGGWGNILVISEDEGCSHCKIHCPK